MPFEIRQCTNQTCNLRIPIDPEIHQGAFCPRCGALMERIVTVPDSHQESGTYTKKSYKMHVLIDNIRSTHNVGAIFRTADGVGVNHIYLCGLTPNPDDNPTIAKTALGAELTLPWSYHPNAFHLVRALHDQGYLLIALERTPASFPLSQLDLAQLVDRAFVLIIGNERAGVDPQILEICNHIVSLPMRGEKESLNVSVAFGIAAYWLSQS
jgi:tRNA G18 (ribose-2'-O)-methylase SpoU